MKRKALAQIPLILGLLVMALAIPVATKLVQQNQDTRNQATPIITNTPAPGGCTDGYVRCVNNRQERCQNRVWVLQKTCPNGCEGNYCKEAPAPTQNPNACNQVYETRKCVNAAEYTCTNNVWVKTKDCSGPCVNNACPAAPSSCNGPNGVSGLCRSPCLTNEIDTGQSNCASPGIRCCIPKPTCSNNGATCSVNSQCCSSHCVTGICVANCSTNGTTCTIDMQCCSSHCVAGKCSATAASPTPTKKPSPTPIPCATTGQSCTTRSCCNAVADVCTDEGLSYPVCVPRNQIPTYMPVPTMVPCAASGQACSTKPCCEPYLDVCTDEGLSYPRCVPRSQIPTYIPVPTQMPCAVTGGSCSSSLGCCAMSDKCTSGKCIAPTPTSTNPTNGPIPTTGGCSGSKPADKCTDPKTLYINAQCVNNQWDWNEQLCNSAGRKESCGGKEYCCPSAGGAWTTDMAKCPTSKCTQCSGKSNAKASGDADCSGITNLVDYSIWREEYLSTQCGNHIMILPNWKADFNCDGLVTLADYDVWKNKYLEMFR